MCMAGCAALALGPAAAAPASVAASAAATTHGPLLQAPLTQLRFRSTQAHLTHTVGDVKVNGQAVAAGVRLEENARITTGADSSAVLELADGSEIRLMPHTVADITLNRYYLAADRNKGGAVSDWFAAKMRLAQGALEAAVNKVAPRAKPLEVETATSLIGVRGTRFRVAAADPTARTDRAEVLQGVVNNENTWKHSAILLQQGQGAAVDPNRADIQAVSLLPATRFGAVETLSQPDAIWIFPAVEQARSYRVIVAADPEFKSVHLSEKLASTSVNLNGLSPGTWHVRVRGIDSMGIEGHDSDTSVVLRAPDSLLLHPSLFLQSSGLTLRWSDVVFQQARQRPQAPSTVSASIYRDASLQQQLGSASDTGYELALPLLAPGTYYLHVTARNSELARPEAQTYRIMVPSDIGNLPYHVLLERVKTS